jgi:hypothetical protein
MALINTGKQVIDYVDDFGTVYANPIPLKFGDDVPSGALSLPGYEDRTSVISCSGGLPFTPRYMEALFSDGSKHKFVIQNRTFEILQQALTTLKGAGALCVNLVGESWSVVPSGLLQSGLTFRSAPFTDIPSSRISQSVAFDYTPDIQTSGTLRLRTSIETNPTALNTCQKSALANTAVSGGGICSGGSLGLTPRKWKIQALATKANDPPDKTRRVVRNAIVSTKTPAAIKSSVTGIAGCSYCVGYDGESVTNLQNLITTAPPN